MRRQVLYAFIAVLGLTTMRCNTSRSTTDNLALTDHHWILVELQGQPVIHEGTNRQASLDFTAEGNKVMGSTSCNRLFATFSLSGDEKITFREVGSTKMACPDMTVENEFLKALSATNAYGISGKELLLKDGEAVVARLRAEP